MIRESERGIANSPGLAGAWLGAVGVAALAAVWLLPGTLGGAAVAGVAVVAFILWYPLAGFVVLAFSVPWLSGSALPLGGSAASPTEVIVAVIGAAWLVSAVTERRNPFAEAPWAGYISLFLAAIVISVTQATDLTASAREILKWGELATVYLAALWFLRTRRDAVVVLAAIVLAGVSQALLGFVQAAFQQGPAAFASARLFFRAYGTFDQPNPYAGYLNMVLPLALALALLSPRASARRWAWAAVVLIAGAVIASESRGALLAGIAALAVVLACVSRPFARTIWLCLVAAVVFAFLVAYGFPLGPIGKISDAIGFTGVDFGHVTDANFSAVERAAHWLAGVRMFAAHPLLGVGIGNYAAEYPAYHPRGWYAALDHAHNYYINIAAEAGTVGLVTYVLLVGSGLWYSCAAMRRTTVPVFRAAGLGVLGALVATSFHNIFDVLYVHGTTALLGLMMALVTVGLRRPAP